MKRIIVWCAVCGSKEVQHCETSTPANAFAKCHDHEIPFVPTASAPESNSVYQRLRKRESRDCAYFLCFNIVRAYNLCPERLDSFNTFLNKREFCSMPLIFQSESKFTTIIAKKISEILWRWRAWFFFLIHSVNHSPIRQCMEGG